MKRLRIDKCDALMAAGLVSGGGGLYLWWGLGVSLTISGALLFSLGFMAGRE